MQLARVKGTVVSTNKAEKLNGLDELKLQPIELFGLVRADNGSLHSS